MSDSSDEQDSIKPVTSVDVAKRAGVSRSAVSRTFTPGASVAPATRERVLKAADELGYRVNQLARSLTNKRSDLVGIVAANMDNPFRAQQVEHIARALVNEGYRPILLPAEAHEDPRRVIGMLLEYNVSGVIVTSDTPPQSICQECVSLGVPMVLVNKAEIDAKVDRVLLDNHKSGALAADFLIRHGCHHLAAIGSEKPSYSLSIRLETFEKAVRASGTHSSGRYTAPFQNYEGGYEAARKLFESGVAVDGIFCVTDYMALGTLDYIRLHTDKRIPEDIQLISCDDILQADWAGYNLTTIRQDTEEVARRVVSTLTMRFEQPTAPSQTNIVDVFIVERGTTKTSGTTE
ncbi:LacI family DNA-binding transcriptional regulator [Cohaesibacter sp. CAU 1516]|uniref:LacI family DNA-binding transcriptional regulator n=1 Tax=Cohaesibacter sp. CAU 1516 TaxID=2576038 RepID=UPI0014857BDF|nr:LacI family DNA-binding transcriptional regulator [Cohaesibacter sp. CAU 1516]